MEYFDDNSIEESPSLILNKETQSESYVGRVTTEFMDSPTDSVHNVKCKKSEISSVVQGYDVMPTSRDSTTDLQQNCDWIPDVKLVDSIDQYYEHNGFNFDDNQTAGKSTQDRKQYLVSSMDYEQQNSVFHVDSCTPINCNCKLVSQQNDNTLTSRFTGSSCSSPPFTPPYSEASIGVNVVVPNLNYDDFSGITSAMSIPPRFLTGSRPSLGDWEAIGVPAEFSCITGIDGSLELQVSYSAIQNKNCGSIVNIGDVILLKRCTQEWFDRWPLTMEVVSIIHCFSNHKISDGYLCVKMRRYFGFFQVSCMLPELALELANREAVVFSSYDSNEILTVDCEFVGCGLILSLSEYYRFWTEITRLRQGRVRRRCPLENPIPEKWQNWVDKPDNVFVLCGQYDPGRRILDSISE